MRQNRNMHMEMDDEWFVVLFKGPACAKSHEERAEVGRQTFLSQS